MLYPPTYILFSYNSFFFFFNDTATTEIYTLSLHDALPISSCRAPWQSHARRSSRPAPDRAARSPRGRRPAPTRPGDRKSTRLNSSHANISYAVFCLKKKKNKRSDVIAQGNRLLSMYKTTSE